MRKLILCMIFFACGTRAMAADYAYTVYGVGNNSCGTWINQANSAAAVQNGAWVLGFVSAFNRYAMPHTANADIANATDARGVLAWMDKYCREHPLDRIVAAVEELVHVLSTRAAAPTRSN